MELAYAIAISVLIVTVIFWKPKKKSNNEALKPIENVRWWK